MQNNTTISISELAKILNVHVGIIRNWERADSSPIPVHRTIGNQRRYLLKDVNQYLGLEENKSNSSNNKKTSFMLDFHPKIRKKI